MLKMKTSHNMDRDIYLRSSNHNTIYAEIEQAKRDMETAFSHFQNASDPDLIDSYIFAEQAAFKRYRFLLKQAQLLL